MSVPGVGLLLVDVQEDFLRRPGLSPRRDAYLQGCAGLLRLFREASLPVLHSRTVVSADGADAMPHWRRAGTLVCRAGSTGLLAPEAVRPTLQEPVFDKTFFSPFGTGSLDAGLRGIGVNVLVVAGLYTESCVRAAVLDAYALGYEVWLVRDVIATVDPLHAEITVDYLQRRACRLVDLSELRALLKGYDAVQWEYPEELKLPNAWIDGHWLVASDDEQVTCLAHYSPLSGELRHVLSPAAPSRLVQAVEAASRAGSIWRDVSPQLRVNMLVSWKAALQDAHQELLACAMAELAKPVADLREEFSRMLVHLDSAIALAGSLFEHISPGVTVRHLPVGCIAIVTPWNNPFAIAVGKIAPALACGNSVVWKPAPETAMTSACLVRTLVAAGMPAGLVSLVHGDGATAEKLIRENGIAAVAVTGSVGTGERVRAACLRLDKPLQAELGGNNSYIIWDGADLPQAALLLSKAGFRFAGQRCTAIRRLIVKRELFDDFTRAFLSAAGKLKIGLPQDADTEFSPMISVCRRARIKDAVTQAVNAGATLLHGGGPMDAWPGGCGFAPTVLIAEPDSNVFVEESFGPVVVLTAADDIRKAVEIGNAVPHGLIAGMWGGGNDERAYFLRHAQAGMLRLDGDMTLDPAAPFCGWKKSSIGPPEHGRWDLEFYARPQVIYGLDRDGSSSHAGGSA